MSSPCFCQSLTASPWTITADSITTYHDPRVVEARGNVVLESNVKGRPAMNVKADWIRYNVESNVIHTRGDISITTDGDKIQAEEATLDLGLQTVKLSDTTVFVSENELYFSGRQVEKTGEFTYEFKDAQVTACKVEEGESPDWAIRTSETTITIEGYAFMKHTRLLIKGIPIVYTPFFVFPAKIKRQTGLLLPEISHSSRDGTGYIQPLFINISPSMDVTLYPGYLERRGPLGGLEFRYVADFASLGALQVNYQRDKTEDTVPYSISNDPDSDYRQDNILRDEHDRYWVRGKADHYFNKTTAAKLDLDFVSDHDYLPEYRDSIIGYDQSNDDFVSYMSRGLMDAGIDFRISRLLLAKNWENTYAATQAVYVSNPLQNYHETIHTLPRVQTNSRLPLLDLPMTLAWDSEYIRYFRPEGLGYQRLDLFPRIITPMPLVKGVEGAISAGFRETLYQIEDNKSTGSWNAESTLNRNVVDIEANVATTLARDYDFDSALLQTLTHTMRPNLIYTYRYTKDQVQKNFPSLDSQDRVATLNGFTYEFNNYFRIAGIDDEDNVYDRNIGHLKISQTYDLNEVRRELTGTNDMRRPFSDITADLDLYPLSGLQLRYQTRFDVYTDGFYYYDLMARASSARGDSLSVDYIYNMGQTTDLQIGASVKVSEKLTVGYSTIQSLRDNHKVNETLNFILSLQCWSVEAEISQNSEEIRAMVIFYLKGIGKAGSWGRGDL